MPEYQILNQISFQGGIDASSPPLSPQSQNSLSAGSWNAIVSGSGLTRGFGGATSMGAGTGSRKMLPFGKTWGGIKDIGNVQGSGSFIEDIGRSRWGIGAGQPCIEGGDVAGFTLSTRLQVQTATAGIFGTPFQAGLTQPSAPELGVVQSAGDVSNPVTAKIERRRGSTGAKSLASPTSAVINPSANRVRVTFPSATSGQSHWRVFFTFQGFGGVGIHYLALYAGITDIPETVVAAGVVDGIARSLEFNYKDGDLLPIEASYDDYTPPAATHLIRLENVMNLAGCYSDSASPTSTNTGTAIAVSKINNYESYVPTHLLFLPEQVTDTLARPVDDYGYVACENSIHAIQYVGYRGDELPPCTITTILPDIGVLFPHNWTHFRGQLLIYSAEGNLLLMRESGEFDASFAGPITRIIKNWNPVDTVVGYDPKNDLICIGNGKTILVYSLAARSWRQIWLPDFGITGTILSATTSRRRLYFTVANGSSLTAYSFDTANQIAPMSFSTNYLNQPSGAASVKDLFEMAISSETSANTQFAVCLAKNRAKSVYRQISISSGANVLIDTESSFSSKLVGKKVIIFAAGIAGAGTVLYKGKVSGFTDTGHITITSLTGTPFASPAAYTDILVFIGDYAATAPINNEGKDFPNFFPNVAECRSYQVNCWLEGGEVGNVLEAVIFGANYQSSRAK